MNFKDKTVIITGGSEGVGAATARAFASAGANLVLVARRKRKLEIIADELRGKTRVEIFAMDVADADACANLFKKAQFEFGDIHILINNAGYHVRKPVEMTDPDDLCRMIDVNLKAPILLTRLALPHIRESGEGAIINVASLAGRTPLAGAAAYGASKFGLRAFTFALADEIPDSKIKLAVVSPGTIDTGFVMDNLDDVMDINFSQPISTAEEVAEAILELCSNSKREHAMPAASGFLTTLTYLFPWIRRTMRPILERKGRAVKRRLLAEQQRAKREIPD
jgi:short-subunit dehydrogenase